MTPTLRKLLFETLYKNRYLYRFASTVPFAGQWRTWQQLVLPRLHGQDVLELGCGLGDLLADMLSAGYTCRAVEHSPQMVAAARDTLRKRGIGKANMVIQGSAQSLPFSNEAFDCVVSTFPNEYILDPDTISEVERVLRPGGRLIVVEGGMLTPVGYIQPLLLLFSLLVYGPRTLRDFWRPGKTRAKRGETADEKQAILKGKRIVQAQEEAASAVTIEELPTTTFGRLIPLERFDLKRRAERVSSQRWEVTITFGEKEA